jgi:diguanylate cyclase (GGDEF)-like protein
VNPAWNAGVGEVQGTVEARDLMEMMAVRVSDEVATWLAARLARDRVESRLRVLRVFPAKAARIKALPDFEAYAVTDPSMREQPAAIGMDSVLVEAIRSQHALTVAAGEGGTRTLVALAAAGEVRYVIDLFTPAGGADDGQAALVEVAAKYFERLSESECDPLTRLSNRRVFQGHIDAGLRQWSAEGSCYFFALMDIDHFKRVNDNFGHLYGDEILVHFANLMRRTFRAGDLLYRFGGEEFVLVYAADPGTGGERVLERFRAALEAYEFPGVGRITVSVGFTRVVDATTPAATLIDRADQAVYYAKAHGRNQVCRWETLVESGELQPRAAANKDVTLF